MQTDTKTVTQRPPSSKSHSWNVITSRPCMAAGSNWKYLSLGVLVFQNTALVLTMRYSRTMDGPPYLASTAVVLMEVLKFMFCTFMVLYDNGGDWNKTAKDLRVEILENGAEMLKISVPSILYTIQNNLLYIALTHLDAATFQVTYQLKILTTALFSVLLLKKKLDKTKWLSLVILMVAVALVQMPSDSGHMMDGSISSAMVGLLSILLACVTSGFSGVYIEKILKGSETSMWIRNIQLSMLSLIFGLFGVFVTDWDAVMDRGFFQGYSLIVALVILLQALGGLVVAAVMKYADNILKGFATSISIVLSSLSSYFLLGDFHPSWLCLVGMLLVLLSTFMYNWPKKAQQLTLSVLPVGTQRTPKTLIPLKKEVPVDPLDEPSSDMHVEDVR